MERSPLTDLAMFATLAELRSFRRAAAALEVSPSALSHRLRKLEEALGVRLLNRTTRSVAPTEAGERLLARLAPALQGIEAGLAELSALRERPAGRLRLNAARTSARLVIAPRLTDFLARYPDVRVEIVTDDRFVDIVESGFDAGVRLGESLQADMIAVRIGPPMRMIAVAAPAYLAGRGAPTKPADLATHTCLRLRWPSGAIYRWELERDGEMLRADVDGPLVTDDNELLKRAALDGAGIAFLLEPHVAPELAEGRLVPLLEGWCPAFPGFHLYYPSRRQVSPALRAFIDHMRA